MLNIKNYNEKINYVGNFGTFSKEGETPLKMELLPILVTKLLKIINLLINVQWERI